MKLEWMGEYRDIIEQLMKYCNVYASVYSKEFSMGAAVPFSFAQIQVVEYLLENEDVHQNMMTIAQRLGITYSTFAKIVARLVKKGFLEKFHALGNRKDVIVRVSDLGRNIYAQYAQFIKKNHFLPMFEALDRVPRENLPDIAAMLCAGLTKPAETQDEKLPILVPITKKKQKPKHPG